MNGKGDRAGHGSEGAASEGVCRMDSNPRDGIRQRETVVGHPTTATGARQDLLAARRVRVSIALSGRSP
jgi:hypothetical protein